MTVRKTIQWLMLIVLVGTGTAAGFAYWIWIHSDEVLRLAAKKKFESILPNCRIEIERARFDLRRRVHLYDLALSLDQEARPVARIPEMILTIDRHELTENERIVVQKIRLLAPEFDVVRAADGQWNFQQLGYIPKSNISLPEWEFVRGTLRLQLSSGPEAAAAGTGFQHCDVRLIPSGKRQYIVEAGGVFRQSGRLSIDGQWDVDTKAWSLRGEMGNVKADAELLRLVTAAAPGLDAGLDGLNGTFAAPPEAAGPPAGPGRDRAFADLGFEGTFSVAFQASRPDAERKPTVRASIDLHNGSIDNSRLPFPLRDLKGHVAWENDHFRDLRLAAKNGVTRLSLTQRPPRDDAPDSVLLEVNLSSLVLDSRLYGVLPDCLKRVYDRFQPEGQIDLSTNLFRDPLRGWRTDGLVATTKEGRCLAHRTKFPYRLTEVTGTVVQRDNRLQLQFTGMAGHRPVKLAGTVVNPGMEAEASFNAQIDQIPLDNSVLIACPETIRKTVQSLQLEGLADVRYWIYRPPGPDRKYQTELHARVANGSLEFEKFPYRLDHLSGIVHFRSDREQWTFTELAARHSAAKIEAGGWYSGSKGLTLTISANDADLDHQLKLALSDDLQKLWDRVAPSGRFNAVANIHWVPGQRPQIELPNVEVFDGGLQLKSFPYPLEQAQAKLAYAGDRVTIHSLEGRHESTLVRVKNGFVTCPRADDPLGNWLIHLGDFHTDDLQPDRILRTALPAGLRSVVEQLNPRGSVSLSGSVEFRGTQRPADPVQAAWKLKCIFSGGSLSAGIELNRLFGHVVSQGQWDGRRVHIWDSSIDLDSVDVWGHQLTEVRGPFELNDRHLVLGSRQALDANNRRESKETIPLAEHITAKAIGGMLTLDAEAMLLDKPMFHVAVFMLNGSLEEYARRYLPRTGWTTLWGVMNGWIELHGEGPDPSRLSGNGRLLIRPAALYELPVIVRVLKAFSLAPPNETAFNYAYANFDVANAQFRFNLIDLIGDAISLRGQGAVGFDGRLRLDFYSMLPQRSLQIPVVTLLVGEAAKSWAGVEVRGHVSNPVATIKAAPQLDNAVRRFLSTFEPYQAAALGNLLIPPFAVPLPPQWQRQDAAPPATNGSRRANSR